MGRGRISKDDLGVLNGLVDGEVVVSSNYSRTKKGNIITHVSKDGSGDTWITKYDVSKSRSNPISSEYIPVNETKMKDDDTPKQEFNQADNELLPKTQRKYLNPTNNKLVGYARAKNLGLI